MLGTWYACLTALKVILLFLLAFYYVPSRVVTFRRGDDGLDRFFISLVYMVGVTLVLVHLTALLGLYDSFSLLAGYAAAIALTMQAQGRSPARVLRDLGRSVVVGLLDAVEGRRSIWAEPGRYFRRQVQAVVLGARLWLGWALNPVGGLIPAAVLVYSAYLRFYHSIAHAYLGAPDSYVHLAWTKYLGANQLYRDGLYPHGYHAVLSALEKLTFVDPVLILRFVGPLVGFLMVLSVYYVSRKLCRGLETLAAPGTLIFGLGIGLASGVLRQASALPQEFSALFVLPGVYFAVRYLERGTRRDLALFAVSLGITVAVHPCASVYLGLGALLAAAVRLFVRPHVVGTQPVWRVALNLFFWGTVAAAIALVPMAIGLARGIKSGGSLAHAAPMAAGPAAVAGHGIPLWRSLLSGEPLVDATIVLAALLTVHAAAVTCMRFFKGERSAESLALLVLPPFCLATYLAYRGGAPGLSSPAWLLDPALAGTFFSLVAGAMYAVVGYRIVTWAVPGLLGDRARALAAAGLAIVAVLLLGFRYPASPPPGARLEYDGAANSYLRIRASFPALDWTIVSSGEQYSQALGKGWHYQSSEFVRDYTVADASYPSFELPIPTSYVFIFAEKVPLHVDRLSWPSPTVADGSPGSAWDSSSAAHGQRNDRADIQAKLIAWAEAYMRSHRNIEVFYEDKEMVVYMIRRLPSPTTEGP